MSRSVRLILTALVLTVAAVGYEYPVLLFRGNARISGGPGIGYTIKMGAIPFNRQGEYVFHFRRIPDGVMSLELYAEGKTDANRKELTSPRTIIESSLVDDNGTVVCSFSGSPSEGQSGQTWALMSAYWGAAFWNWSCTHISVRHSSSYTLTLRVKDIDPNTPEIRLLPMLKSDGHVWS